MKLDEKDRALLSILAVEARTTNRELAKRIGLSPSSCLARVKRLEAEGVIVGYRAIVCRTGRGVHVEGWADVRLVEPTNDQTQKFLSLLRTTSEIIEAHRIAGHYDYVIRFAAGGGETWSNFRRGLEGIGCESTSRFSVLLENLNLALHTQG